MRSRRGLGPIGGARLPWLLVLPIVLAGSLLARRTAAVCAGPAGEQPGHEALELRRATAVGGLPLSLLIAAGASLAALALALAVARLFLRRPLTRCSARLFLTLAPLAFVGQELAERALRHELSALDAAALRRLLLGLSLQLPFAAACYLVASALWRGASRIVRLLLQPPRPAAISVLFLPRPARATDERRPCVALALGYGERGPPLLPA